MRPEELANAIAAAINGSGSTKTEAYGVSYFLRAPFPGEPGAWLFIETLDDTTRRTYKVEITEISNAPR